MATPDPELDYLQPGFDPASATVPRLRNILVSHEVPYPSSAKKAQLVDIFNQSVTPKAKKILGARSRTVRTTRGIKDVPSSNASTVDEEEEEEPEVTPAPSVARSTRRRTRATNSEVSDFPEFPTGRTPSARTSRQSSLHAEDVPTTRRTRMSATPALLKEVEEPQGGYQVEEDSPFSNDNPFQSGSSPIAAEVKPRRDSRRKTLEPEAVKTKRASTTSRRRTDFPVAEQYVAPAATKSRRISVPIRQPSVQPEDEQEEEEEESDDLPEDEIEAGEEFTPEEQLELVRERAKNGKLDILPPRQNQVAKRTSSTVQPALWSVIMTLFVATAAMWRQEKLAVGYCGLGQPSYEIAGVQIPEWADSLRPVCEPCPPHARCLPNMDIICDEDYIKQEHPLSLFGLVPLPPTCEPDGEKVRRVKEVADKAVDELRVRNAEFECGDLKDEEGHKLASPGIEEQELKQLVARKKSKRMSDLEFDDLWRGAIGDIIAREEVTQTKDEENNSRRILVSSSLARIGPTCAIRRSIRVALARYLWQLVGALLLAAGGGYAKLSITSGRTTEEKAKELASYTFERLAQQASWHAYDQAAYPEDWLFMTQLRDDILRNEFSASRRQKLWVKVQKKVEQNSNIRSVVKEGRNGEVGRAWQWIGAVGAIEDLHGSAERRKSGRYSLPASSSPALESSLVQRDDVKPLGHRDDGRPIY